MRSGKRISTVLIADDQLLFRRGLRALLSVESDLEVIGEAASFAEVLLKQKLLTPDVLVMSLEMFDPSERELVFSLRKSEPRMALLLLGQRDGEVELESAVAVGAQGYMLKNSPPAQLLAAVRQIVTTRDQGIETPPQSTTDLQALAANNRPSGSKSVLTAREQEVVRLLADGRTVREVASDLRLSVKTIEAHKLNLMRKLDIHDRATLLAYAAQHGLATPHVPVCP